MTPHEMYVIAIAEERGIDRQMILDALGIVCRHDPKRRVRHKKSMSASDEEEAARLRMSGKSYESIARALGLGRETIRTHLMMKDH